MWLSTRQAAEAERDWTREGHKMDYKEREKEVWKIRDDRATASQEGQDEGDLR